MKVTIFSTLAEGAIIVVIGIILLYVGLFLCDKYKSPTSKIGICILLFFCFVALIRAYYEYFCVSRIYAVNDSGWYHYSEWRWNYKTSEGERFKTEPHRSYFYNETERDVIVYPVLYSMEKYGEEVSCVLPVDTLKGRFVELNYTIGYAFEKPESIRNVEISTNSTDTIFVLDFADKYGSKKELPNKTIKRKKWRY